jgi:hypothetical protein
VTRYWDFVDRTPVRHRSLAVIRPTSYNDRALALVHSDAERRLLELKRSELTAA